MKQIAIIVGLLLIFSGCGSEEAKTPAPAPNPVSSPASEPEVEKAEPVYESAVGDDNPDVVDIEQVKISPEDQEIAKKAPEGMVFIKGGCFIMGNDFAQADEKPEHEVCLDSFYMDKYEVTQERWEKVMGFNPSRHIGKNFPVEQVNYFDIQEFIEESKGACRLPTEAEWEYAAGLGIQANYYWGNIMDPDYAWYIDNSEKTTHAVGQKKPNQFGLHDMLGSVWEWVEDWYEPYYSALVKDNPKGPGNGEYKVIRGGGFDSSAGALRVTNRIWLHPKNRVYTKVNLYGGAVNEVYNYIGFRCAKSIS